MSALESCVLADIGQAICDAFAHLMRAPELPVIRIDALRYDEQWNYNDQCDTGIKVDGAIIARGKPREIFAHLRAIGVLGANSAGRVALGEELYDQRVEIVDRATGEPLFYIDCEELEGWAPIPTRADVARTSRVVVDAYPEDVPIRGNALASGDPELDREHEDDLIAELDGGNEWAWCRVEVTARLFWLDTDYSATVHLGACSYASEEDFVACNYYEDLKKEAIDELIAKLPLVADRHKPERKRRSSGKAHAK